jgi:hypothetical protein
MTDSFDNIKQVKINAPNTESNAWSTEKVDEWIYQEQMGLEHPHGSPFSYGAIGFRKGNIVFKYTEDEINEIRKCKKDINYFADKYAFAMTDDGVAKINLYGFQRDILKNLQDHRFSIICASRQIGKTVTSSIFLTWFVCFHFDKNIMIVANKGATVKEIIDKVKVVYENLPFFLKPGIITNNVGSMKFDNGSRFIGQNTSKTPGLGFTIHLLYADEFAHIQPNIINDFYRSIFPTMSSSKMSRMIITSTANGMNKFYEIYSKAVKGENDFHPMKIDWDAVPGRDEAWKQAEIANLGSEEEFKQEYENQFFSDSQMALDRYTMKKLMKYSDNYIWTDIAELEDEGIRYNNLIWDKSYASFYFSPFDRFVLSVDISSGTGKDYSVITIFKVEPKSLAKIRTMRRYDDEA